MAQSDAHLEVLPGKMVQLINRVSEPVTVIIYSGADVITEKMSSHQSQTIRLSGEASFIQVALEREEGSNRATKPPVLFPVKGGQRYVLVWNYEVKRVEPHYVKGG